MRYFLIGFFLLISLTGCEKKILQESNDEMKTQQNVIPAIIKQDNKQNDIYYTKNLMNLGYLNRNDVGKNLQQLEKGTFHRLGIGVKAVCQQVEFEDEKEIFLVELENSKKVWMSMDDLVKGVIVINKPNIPTYELPDLDRTASQNVQPGDLGYIITSYKDWLYVDFRGYRPYGTQEEKIWIGKKWIHNSGYLMDGDLAGQAMYLYFAYYQLMKDRNEDAKTNLTYAKNITSKYSFMNRILDTMLGGMSSSEDSVEENVE